MIFQSMKLFRAREDLKILLRFGREYTFM